MKKAFMAVSAAALVLSAGFLGCDRAAQDSEAEIRSLLAGSGYTNESQSSAYGSSDTSLAGGGEGGYGTDGYDTIPFVRFRRFIPEGGVSRNVNVQIPAWPGYPDTTALATITVDIIGELRTMFDNTRNPFLVWRKPFHDRGVRRVFLTRDETGWHIRRVTPMDISTVDAAYSLRLVSLHAAAASGEVFDLTDPDTLLEKAELPTFVPGDTVTVTITLESTGDSGWVFLHHGRPARPGCHFRRPYYRTGTLTFERTWYIGTETYDAPEVRPSAHDAIGWGSLWSDTTAPYVSNAWGIPYVVKNPGDPLPSEE